MIAGKTTLLGLELPADSEILNEPITGVRQSRRIAQLKIKEEAERRKIEESVLNEMKADHKKKKSKKSEDKVFIVFRMHNCTFQRFPTKIV